MALKHAVRMPIWFISHGGGPMPLLDDRHHTSLVQNWKGLSSTLPSVPKAILIISAHWEEKVPTVNVSAQPGMFYDYYNFPEEAYKVQYKAPGSPAVGSRVLELLRKAGLQAAEDSARGYDHGVFVPLKFIFPEANIPVVEMSILSSLDPKKHLELGKAIGPIRDEGVLIIGSGFTFHNMRGFDWDSKQPSRDSQEFDDWLRDTLAGKHSPEERMFLFSKWEQAPSARAAHPREEHLLPLHVALGSAEGRQAEVIFNDTMLGAKVSSFKWA